MAAASPHLNLNAHGFIEPLARGVAPPASGRPEKVKRIKGLVEQKALEEHIQSTTDRLAAKSQWLPKRREEDPSSPSSPRRLSPPSVIPAHTMDDVSLSSSFSRLGTWEPKSPPQPTVPRTPQRTTLLQRRVKDGENGRGEWTVPPPTKAFLEEEAQQRAAAREEVELDRAAKQPWRHRQPVSPAAGVRQVVV